MNFSKPFVCDQCFAVVVAPDTHAEWHRQLTPYLTPDTLEAEAQSTSTGSTNGK